jgi:single-strand DNA-binding protein
MIRNQISLVGSVPFDVDYKTFDNGGAVARFKLNTSSTPSFELHKVFAFGNLAKFIHEYCNKGSRLAISGKLVNRTFITETGKVEKTVEIEVRNITKIPN